MTLLTLARAFDARSRRSPLAVADSSALAAGAPVDHPSNGGITGDVYPERPTESDAGDGERATEDSSA